MYSIIKASRKDAGITQRQLADKMSVSGHYIYLLETNRRRPSIELAKKLSEELGFDWTLCFETGDMSSLEKDQL